MKKYLSHLCPFSFICDRKYSPGILNGACILILAVAISGCSSPGTLMARQDRDAVPKMGTAPVDGTYGLFIAGQQQNLYEVSLKRGQPLGFEAGEEGVIRWLYATAGIVRNRLDVTQVYEWRLVGS